MKNKKGDRNNLKFLGSDFLSMAVHQLRTPLVSMKWITDMLLKEEIGKLNKDQKEFVKDAYSSVIHMEHLVNHLLSIARMESGSLGIIKNPINIKDLCDEIIREMRPLLQDKGHKLNIKNIKKPIIINTDQTLLMEILKNLISNAIKYTPEKGNVVISLKKEDRKSVV